METNIIDFSKPIPSSEGDYPSRPSIEFTEDDWTTIYTGYCVESSIYSYLVEGGKYGRLWIPKHSVRLAKTMK